MNTSAYLDGYMHKAAGSQTLSYGDEIDDEIREEGASPRRRKKKPAKKTSYIPALAGGALGLTGVAVLIGALRRARRESRVRQASPGLLKAPAEADEELYRKAQAEREESKGPSLKNRLLGGAAGLGTLEGVNRTQKHIGQVLTKAPEATATEYKALVDAFNKKTGTQLQVLDVPMTQIGGSPAAALMHTDIHGNKVPTLIRGIKGDGVPYKPSAPVLAHELGHLQGKQLTRNTLGKVLYATGKKLPAVAAIGTVADNNEDRARAYAAGSSVATIPMLAEELRSSHAGNKMLRAGGIRPTGLGSYKGVPTYLLLSALPWMTHGAKRLFGGYNPTDSTAE